MSLQHGVNQDILQSNSIIQSSQSGLHQVQSQYYSPAVASHVFVYCNSYDSFKLKDRITWMYRGLNSQLKLENPEELINGSPNEDNNAENKERCIFILNVLSSINSYKKISVLDQNGLLNLYSSTDGTIHPSTQIDLLNESINKNRYTLSSISQIHTLYNQYNILFTVDISPSMLVLDPINGEVVFDRVYICLEKIIRDLSKKLQIPGFHDFHPEINISVIAVGGHMPSIPVVENLTIYSKEMNLKENSFDSHINSCIYIVKERLKEVENIAAKTFSEWNFYQKSSPNVFKANFNSIILESLTSFELMPSDACPSLVVITDGVFTLSNLKPDTFSAISSRDASFTLVNVSNLEVSEHNFCYIPNFDFMNFVVHSANGTLIHYDFLLTSTEELNLNQSALRTSSNSGIASSLQKDLLEERKIRYLQEALFLKHLSLISTSYYEDGENILNAPGRNNIHREGLVSDLCREYGLKSSRLDTLLKHRISQGFHVKLIDFMKKRVEALSEQPKPSKIQLHFQIRPNIYIEYISKALQDPIDPIRSGSTKNIRNRSLNVEIYLHSPPNFSEQFKKASKKLKKSGDKTIKTILNLINNIYEEDNDLEKLFSFSDQDFSNIFKRKLLSSHSSDINKFEYSKSLFDYERFTLFYPKSITPKFQLRNDEDSYSRSPLRYSYEIENINSEQFNNEFSQIEKIIEDNSNCSIGNNMYIVAIPSDYESYTFNFQSIKRDNDRIQDSGFCIIDFNVKAMSIKMIFFNVSSKQRIRKRNLFQNNLSKTSLRIEKGILSDILSNLQSNPSDTPDLKSLFLKQPKILNHFHKKKWNWNISSSEFCVNSIVTLITQKRLREGFEVIYQTNVEALFRKELIVKSHGFQKISLLFYSIYYSTESKHISTCFWLEPISGNIKLYDYLNELNIKYLVKKHQNFQNGIPIYEFCEIGEESFQEVNTLTGAITSKDIIQLNVGEFYKKRFQFKTFKIILIFILSWIYHYGNNIDSIPDQVVDVLFKLVMKDDKTFSPFADISDFISIGSSTKEKFEKIVKNTQILTISNLPDIESLEQKCQIAHVLSVFFCKLYFYRSRLTVGILEKYLYETDSDIISLFCTFEGIRTSCQKGFLIFDVPQFFKSTTPREGTNFQLNIQGLWKRGTKRIVELPLLDFPEDNDQLLKRLHLIVKHANSVEIPTKDISWEESSLDEFIEENSSFLTEKMDNISSDAISIESDNINNNNNQKKITPISCKNSQCYAMLVGETGKLLLTFVPLNISQKSNSIQIVICECSQSQLFDIEKVKSINPMESILKDERFLPNFRIDIESDIDSIIHYQHFLEELHSHSFTFGLFKRFQKQSTLPLNHLKKSIESCVEYSVDIDLSDLMESILISKEYFYKSVAEYESPHDEISKYFDYLIKKHFLLPDGSQYHFVMREKADKNASTILSASNLFLHEFEDVGEDGDTTDADSQSSSSAKADIITGKSEFFSDTSSNSFNAPESSKYLNRNINLPAYFRMECRVSVPSTSPSNHSLNSFFEVDETYNCFPTSELPIDKINNMNSGKENQESDNWLIHHIDASSRKSFLRLILISFPPDKFMLGDNNCEPQDPSIIKEIFYSHERNRFSYCSSKFDLMKDNFHQEDEIGDPFFLDISYLPANLRKLMQRTTKKTQALVSKEIINCLLHASPLSEYILKKVKYHMRNLPPQCYGTTPYDLKFVDPIQGPILFETEFRKYKHDKIQIVKLGQDYVIKMKRLPNKRPSYYSWHDQYLNDEDYENNRIVQKIQHSSSFPDLLGGDDLVMSPDGVSTYDIFSSREGEISDNIFDDDNYIDETPYWLIVTITEKRCTVLFYSPFPITSTQRNVLNGSVKQAITDVNKRVNTLLLLNDLHETRYCSNLLLPPSEADLKMEVESSRYDQENYGEFEVGEFECGIVHHLLVELHSRLSPEISMMQLGETVFFSFEVFNRKNVYVCRESNGRVFYIRLAEYTEDTDLDILQPQNKPLSLSHVGNYLASQRKGDSKKQSHLKIEVYGIDPPSTIITEQLMESVKSKLSALNLGFLSNLLSKNRRFKLTLSDLEFLRPLNSPGNSIAKIKIPRFVQHKYLFLLLLRQNMSFLNQMRVEVSEDMEQSSLVNEEDRIFVIFEPLDFSFLYNFKTFDRMSSEISIGQGIACIHLTPLNSNGEILGKFSIQKYNLKSDFISEWENSSPETLTVEWSDPTKFPLKICKEQNLEEDPMEILFEIWTKGDINSDILLDRLTLSVNHTNYDYLLEFALFSQALNDKNVSLFLDSYSSLLQKAIDLQSPSVNSITFHIFLPHWTVEEFSEHVFSIIKEFEETLNPQIFKLSSPSNDVKSPLYSIIGGHFGSLSIKTKQLVHESHIAFHTSLQIGSKYCNLLRNCAIIATISNSELKISTFNMKRSRFNELQDKIQRYTSFTKCRQLLLTSILHQKLGLFHHVEQSNLSSLLDIQEQNTTKQKLDFNLRFNDIDALLISSRVPTKTTKSKTVNPKNSMKRKNELTYHQAEVGLDVNKPFNILLRGLNPSETKMDGFPSADPLKFHGSQFKEIITKNLQETVEKSRISHIYTAWEKSSNASPNSLSRFNSNDLSTIKKTSRLFHFSRSPLFFNDLRQLVFEPTLLDKLEFSKITSEKYEDPQVRREFALHIQLQRSFLDEYSHYLRDHMDIHDSLIVNDESSALQLLEDKFISTDKVTLYFQKIISGGIILIEISIENVFCSLNLYVSDLYDRRNQVKVQRQNRLQFLQHIGLIKHELHLNSFLYDYHLRKFYIYLTKPDSEQFPKINLLNIFNDFLAYHKNPPIYSRNNLHYVQNDKVVQLPQYASINNLLMFIQKKSKYYGKKEYRRLNKAIVIPQSSSIVTKYNYIIVVNLQDSKKIIPIRSNLSEDVDVLLNQQIYIIILKDENLNVPARIMEEKMAITELIPKIQAYAEDYMHNLIKDILVHFQLETLWQQIFEKKYSIHLLQLLEICKRTDAMDYFDQSLNAFNTSGKDIPWKSILIEYKHRNQSNIFVETEHINHLFVFRKDCPNIILDVELHLQENEISIYICEKRLNEQLFYQSNQHPDINTKNHLDETQFLLDESEEFNESGRKFEIPSQEVCHLVDDYVNDICAIIWDTVVGHVNNHS